MDMVTSVTNFGRSGLSDWLLQRATAVVLLAYFVFLAGFLVCTPDLSYEAWKALFACNAMKIFSLLALFSLVAHAWIGLWSVSTDYLTERAIGSKATAIRLLFQGGYTALAFVYLIWGVQILWGV